MLESTARRGDDKILEWLITAEDPRQQAKVKHLFYLNG